MQCLIVAAGQGTRLRMRGPSKPLAMLAGKPLISHVLSRAQIAGIHDFVVVTGHYAEHLENYLNDFATKQNLNIFCVYNPNYLQPNGHSVLAARDALTSPFLLTMCDHIIDPKSYRKMASCSLGKAAVMLGIDTNLQNPYVDLDDVTKVKIHKESIVAIGKELIDYNAFDTGLFLATHDLLDAIAKSSQAGNCTISGGVSQLAAKEQAHIYDITGSLWIDVDSPELFDKAERLLISEQNY